MEFFFRRSYRGPLRAVILDWAGTTVDFGCCAPTQVFKRVFEKRGVVITDRQAREPMGLHKRDHIRAISQMDSVAEQWREIHGKDCTDEDIQTMFEDFVPLQIDCLADFADLTPGTMEAVKDFRNRGMKIGTTTGYNREMLEILLREAAKRGYEPDVSFCAADVPAGRPAPWMIYRNLMELGVYPNEACVKIGDTPSDIAEGLNAGMWTVGVTKVGNEVGLSEEEIEALSPERLRETIRRAGRRLCSAGAHFVVETLADVPAVLDRIMDAVKNGERP